MNLRLIVTILVVIAAAPICAQAQKQTPAKVTKADAQKVLKIISSNKVKTRIYCEMAKLGDQTVQANETGDAKKIRSAVSENIRIGKKLGPEYAALIDGLQDTDRNPKSVRRLVRHWMRSIICGGVVHDV